MKTLVIIAVVGLAACSGSSPTAPTTPIVATPPVVVTPPTTPTTPSSPAPNPLLSDPRYDRNFYFKFALGQFERGALQPLRRHTQAPSVYLFTANDRGAAIDTRTLDVAAAALINVTGALTGVFGLEGLERGTGTTTSKSNRITVRWSSLVTTYCGEAEVGGNVVTLFPMTPGCACGGAAIRAGTVKHEMGHALGYWHTDSPADLMYGTSPTACDRNPSERELFHARVAYSMPIGSIAP